MNEDKQRLDIALTERKLVRSRSAAADLIKRGKVFVNGKEALKASAQIAGEDVLTISEKETYVGRGGIKLAHALNTFLIDPKGKICVDIGSSTGGFTDCFLQRGAEKVYAIDVGSNQLDPSLRANTKVSLFEQTDVRNVKLPEKGDIAAIDVSFISVTHILKEASDLTRNGGDIIILVKPQFEVGKDHIGKNGIVTNKNEQEGALNKIKEAGLILGLVLKNTTESPIEGGDGNKEYFIHFINILK